MNEPSAHSRPFDVRAKRRIAAGVGALSVVAMVVVVLFNVLVGELSRHVPIRHDLTQDGWHSMESATRDFVRGLPEGLEIYVIWGEDDALRHAARVDDVVKRVDPVVMRDVYRPFVGGMARGVIDTVNEMRHVNGGLRLFTSDDRSALESTREWARRAGLSGPQMVNNVVFRNPETRAVKAVSFWRVFPVDLGGPLPGGARANPVVRGDFIEPALVWGLKSVLDPGRNRVLMTKGRGEIEAAGVREVLSAENWQLGTVNLEESGVVPEGCDVLLVLSPSEEWSNGSRRALEDYLGRGGRVLLTQGRLCRERFDTILEGFGLKLGTEQVRHRTRHAPGQGPAMIHGWDLLDPPAGEAPHPVTAKIVEDDHAMLFGFVRRYVTGDDWDRGAIVRNELADCGAGSELVPYAIDAGDVRFRLDLMTRVSEAPFAFALQRSRAAAPPGRLIVLACDDWLTREPLVTGFSLGNRDLLINSMLWLTDRTDLATGTPRSFRGRIVPFDRDSFRTFKWLVVGLLPALILLIGGLVRALRMR